MRLDKTEDGNETDPKIQDSKKSPLEAGNLLLPGGSVFYRAVLDAARSPCGYAAYGVGAGQRMHWLGIGCFRLYGSAAEPTDR